jgi:hypothetical protein
VDAAATAEPNAKEALQAAGDLAVGQARLLVEFDDGGLGSGPQLRGSRAEGIGRLQGIGPLSAALARTALADVDVKLPVDGLARDIDLELLGNVGLVERAAAVGADIGQRCPVDFVDLFRGR